MLHYGLSERRLKEMRLNSWILRLKKYDKKAYCQNKEESQRQYAKKWWNDKRWRILTHYSGFPPKCACCGETEYKFLSIDHINGGGLQHRKQISEEEHYKGKAGLRENKFDPRSFERWIIKNNFPDGLQILCYNCNLGRAHNGGICPHKK